VDYLQLLDYGLADALPNPQAFVPHGAKRADSVGGGQPLRY
jgi:hypothetical protein